MKESVTKFDLEAAFKALNEIEIPQAKKGIKANRPALTEIFSKKTKLDSLVEDYYDISNSEELSSAKEAREAEVAKAKLARIEKIVDLNAESAEDLLTSYVGKLIIQCPQCMTLFYKDQEDIVEDETDPTNANVGEICQHCGNETGYTLVGKVGEVTPEEAADYQAAESEDNLEIDIQGTTEETPDEAEGQATEEEPNFDGEDVNFEDIDLDFEIEDDEAEAGKEESFKANGSLFLTEDLKESSETDDFKTLLAMPEFKKPISDQEVRALLGEQYESDDSLDSLAIDGFTYEILDTFEDAGYTGSNVRYSKEGQNIVDIEFWNTNEPISVVKNWLTPNLFQKTYDNFEDFSNDLVYKVVGQQNSDDASLIEGALDKFKDKVATALNKPLGTTATANWILENALKDYEKDPDESNRHFDHFLALCFKNQYADGEKITKAPKWDDERLLPLKDRSKKYSDYKGAEAFGKAESSKDDCGAVIIYLASKKAPNDIAMVSLFFDGTLQKDQDQIDTYYKEIAQAIASTKRYQNQSKKASKFEIK
jgi:hypothetical protein